MTIAVEPTPRGRCAERFEAVHDVFARSLAEGSELGGGVCVTLDGEVVVDLVGGAAEAGRTRPWDADTIAMVWSATKGALATCVHLLAVDGELELDAPVARWWPEFASHGKHAITVAMVLDHQAGVPGLSGGDVGDEVLDFDAMVERVAAEAPQWEPGSRHGYHSFTFGWILGEVVRRVTGLTPGRFFAQQVAAPLGLDFWIGLPASEDARVARVCALPLVPTPDVPFGAALEQGAPIQRAVVDSWGRFTDVEVCRLRAARGAEVPAANGFTNARGLALLYRPLATDGRIGDRALSDAARARMGAVASASARDAVLLFPTRYGSGFQKGPVVRGPRMLGMPESAFGHVGQGGSFGFADPARRLSVGYVTCAHEDPIGPSRGQALADAVYAALGA